jgi:hypothetical protein
LANNGWVYVDLFAWWTGLALWAFIAWAIVTWALLTTFTALFFVAAWTALGLAARRAWLHASANSGFASCATEQALLWFFNYFEFSFIFCNA